VVQFPAALLSIVVGRPVRTASSADLISRPEASGNFAQSSATAPVTNGAAALVPLAVTGLPFAPRLVISTPGAPSPDRPVDRPMVE
jgi:hypothetical protein